MDLDAIIAKKLPESAVNPMGAPSNAPIGRSVIGDTAPEKVSPAKAGSVYNSSITDQVLFLVRVVLRKLWIRLIVLSNLVILKRYMIM